jgi:hypothetical protein
MKYLLYFVVVVCSALDSDIPYISRDPDRLRLRTAERLSSSSR